MPQVYPKKDALKCWREHFDSRQNAFYDLVRKCEGPDIIKERLLNVIDYNVSGGKRIRGALVAWSLSAFHPRSELIPEELLDFAHLVGWCVELLHAGFLVLDDIIDESPIRRGKPAWHVTQQRCGLGFVAVNDGLHLFSGSKLLLHEILASLGDATISTRSFLTLLQLFDEVGFNTICGQAMDILSSQQPVLSATTPLASRFSSAVYEQVTHWKTAMYTFYLPVAAGMILAGVDKKEEKTVVKEILVSLGQYFQAQDDFLDCFGDPSVTGKVGTDIAEGKCTWLIVEAVKLASLDQLKLLQDNYGRKEAQPEELVRGVYKELDLPAVFRGYEKRLQHKVATLIEKHFPASSPRHAFFNDVRNLLFCRSK